jgi:ATP-independent RNA helicase DbpA
VIKPDGPSPNQAKKEDGELFSTLPLNKPLLDNLISLDFKHMTPIQAQTLPHMLSKTDIIAQAQTGSGKTAAFGLTLLNHLNLNHYAVQSLVLCPTRELALQVTLVLRKLARLIPNIKILGLSGGVPIRTQLESLKHHAHIIVGTPGRVQKHLDNGSLSLNSLQTLVLDEADRMLDMGFFDAIKDIIATCPVKRQTLLFSATYPPEIKQLASQFMLDPKRITIEETQNSLDIDQKFYEVPTSKDKLSVLKHLLYHHPVESTLIFCNTKEKTTELAGLLKKEGFSARALNGDMEQASRDLTMIRFTNRSCSILVATDVASRGLDIKDLPVVINFDLAFEEDVHIHRIGRTGRAGTKGIALSITTPADGKRLCLIEEALGHDLIFGDINELSSKGSVIPKPKMQTLSLSVGKKDKIRPGDILGALIKDAGLAATNIGKIDISPLYSYVAIERKFAEKAYLALRTGRIKGRGVKVKVI